MIGRSKKEVITRLTEYLEEHRDEDDHIDDEEWEEMIGNVESLIDDGAPELNSLHQCELYIDQLPGI
jgi:hypothetical protein